MHAVSAIYAIGPGGEPKVVWQIVNPHFLPADQGFRASVCLNGTYNKREAVRQVVRSLRRDGIDWLTPKGQRWIFDAAKFRDWLPKIGRDEAERQKLLTSIEWLTGAVVVEPELAHETVPYLDAQPRISTYVQFDLYREEFLVDRKTKIFLSHKGANKPMVRQFFTTLKLLGFDPWLDEDAMPGGTELLRGIQEGMTNSCAAVFFITPQFKDEAYLRGEVNLAMQEKTQRADRFTILSLAMLDETGQRGSVPPILHQWTWKEPGNEMEALNEIIRSLPIELGPPSWKAGI